MISNEQRKVYEMMDLEMLTNLLLTADQRPDVQRAALSALSKRPPLQRNSKIILILEYVLKYPDRYNQDVMMSAIDILGTDPGPDATAAMLEILPRVLDSAMKKGDALKPEFRRYFYQTLITRQRETDMPVWKQMLPTLQPETLVAALLDPAAKPLRALEPLTLINRLPAQERRQALMSLFVGALQRMNLGLAGKALNLMLSPPHSAKRRRA